MPYANNKDADQPAHPRSLINAFVDRCLDSIISPVFMSKFQASSFCGCAGRILSYLVATPEDRFSRDGAHMHLEINDLFLPPPPYYIWAAG